MLGGGRFSGHKNLLLFVDLVPVMEIRLLGLSDKVSKEGRQIGLCPKVFNVVWESPVI